MDKSIQLLDKSSGMLHFFTYSHSIIGPNFHGYIGQARSDWHHATVELIGGDDDSKTFSVLLVLDMPSPESSPRENTLPSFT